MNVETKQNKQTKFTFLGVCYGRHSGKQIEETKVADTYIHTERKRKKETNKNTINQWSVYGDFRCTTKC